jgi:hypothetical protein
VSTSLRIHSTAMRRLCDTRAAMRRLERTGALAGSVPNPANPSDLLRARGSLVVEGSVPEGGTRFQTSGIECPRRKAPIIVFPKTVEF